MSSDVSLFFASVNIGCADPVAMAHFWGQALGRPVTSGVWEGVMAVGSTDLGSRPQMIFFPAREDQRSIGGFVPTLLTDDHDEETGRLTALGATLVEEVYQAPIRLTSFTDPEGNRFQLATFKPE